MVKRLSQVIVASLLLGLIQARAAQKPDYLLGLHSPGEGYFGASLKTGFEGGAQGMKQNTGITIQFSLFKTLNTLFTAVDQGKVDLVFSISETVYLHSLNRPYKPFLAYSVFGKAEQRYCLYVPKNSTVKSAKDLKGKNAITYEDDWAYLMLTDLVGAPPDQFFDQLDISPGGVSTAYALSLGQVSAGLINSQAYDLMKLVNPGPLKSIRPLTCGKWYPTTPVLASSRVKPQHLEAIRKELPKVALGKDKAYSRVAPLIRRLTLAFTNLNPKALEVMKSRYQKGKASGLIQQHNKWAKVAIRRK